MSKEPELFTSPFPVRVTWVGSPATKKTSQRIIRPRSRKGSAPRPPIILPSVAYSQMVKTALPQIRSQYSGPPLDRGPDGKGRLLSVRVRYFLAKRQRPDVSGLYEATGDLLQAAGVISNDYWIEQWPSPGGVRFKDFDNPRTEVMIDLFKGESND